MRMKRIFTISAVMSVCWASAIRAQDIPAEYQQVLTTLGRHGDYKANVLKVNIPRNDVTITVANVKTPTPFGVWRMGGDKQALLMHMHGRGKAR